MPSTLKGTRRMGYGGICLLVLGIAFIITAAIVPGTISKMV
jgi:hypothetical protein